MVWYTDTGAETDGPDSTRRSQNSCNFLILDEPTAPLSDTETEELFRVVKHLRETENIAIIFITHRIQEDPSKSVVLTQL